MNNNEYKWTMMHSLIKEHEKTHFYILPELRILSSSPSYLPALRPNP